MSAKSKTTPSDVRSVLIREAPIELSQFLKFSGSAESGGQATQAVADGEVLLNGVVETRKGKKLVAGDKVTFRGETLVVQVAG
jgi:ribosome-associated protein